MLAAHQFKRLFSVVKTSHMEDGRTLVILELEVFLASSELFLDHGEIVLLDRVVEW